MFASSSHRYSHQRSSYYNSSNQSQSYSPTKYSSYASSAMGYDDSTSRHQSQYYSPPLKGQSYQRSYQSSSYGDYYSANNNQNSHYYHQDGTTYFHSSSSTASSSQEGYYDDLDEFDDIRSAFSLRPDADPEMSTIPTIPTPIALSIYEGGKTPSGRVLVTSGNQTVEFFSCVVNAPSRGIFVAE